MSRLVDWCCPMCTATAKLDAEALWYGNLLFCLLEDVGCGQHSTTTTLKLYMCVTSHLLFLDPVACGGIRCREVLNQNVSAVSALRDHCHFTRFTHVFSNMFRLYFT